jgi:glycerate 2-kinase
MKILIAPDKFKGSLEATEVCRAVEEGVKLAFPFATTLSVPLADGGEGTTRILTEYSDGKFISVITQDALGRPVEAKYGISGDGETAFIEMAAASGLLLLSREEYNPMLTSTFGTGELILHALECGVKKIILGIGGSATTDGGTGMAGALGYRFYDEYRDELQPVGGSLDKIVSIDLGDVNPLLKTAEIVVACDVTAPLYGTSGAAYVYGPQKGADQEMVRQLDDGLRNLSKVATGIFGKDISQIPGTGAAGGLGAGAIWFLNATLQEGTAIVMQQTGIEKEIENADLIITGEGKVDEQTLQGKVIKGLADLCKRYNAPLAVICGTLSISAEEIQEAGITYAVSVLNKPSTLEQAQADTFANIKDATFNLVRLFFFGS